MLRVHPTSKGLVAFAGRFFAAFFFALQLWFFLSPPYNHLLASSVNLVLPFTEKAPAPRLMAWEHDLLLTRPSSTSGGKTTMQGFRGNLTHFNLILMVALVFSPRHIDWRSRCRMLVIALGMLFLAHVAYLVIGVKFFAQPELEALQSATGRLYVWGVNFYLSIASQLLPILIGLLLYRFVVQTPAQKEKEKAEKLSSEAESPTVASETDRAAAPKTAGVLLLIAGPAALGLTTMDPSNPSLFNIIVMLLAWFGAAAAFTYRRKAARITAWVVLVVCDLFVIPVLGGHVVAFVIRGGVSMLLAGIAIACLSKR